LRYDEHEKGRKGVLVAMKQKTLWVFDFDGTLSEIVPNYHAAMLDPDCREMLIMLIKKFGMSVAVISSRPLSDLSPRIDVPGFFLGGSCGLVWLQPDGDKKSFNTNFQENLDRQRAFLLPKIKEMQLVHDVIIEDKLWSLTVHLRTMAPRKKQQIINSIAVWQEQFPIRVLHEPEALEIHFLPEINKLTGLQHFCSLLDVDPSSVQITYAGDDEADIPVMYWVLRYKGFVYSVGDAPLIPEATAVGSPKVLAREIRKQADQILYAL
jgi:trehalose-phosphatase